MANKFGVDVFWTEKLDAEGNAGRWPFHKRDSNFLSLTCLGRLGPVREFLDVAKYQPKRFDVEILLHVRKSAVREKFHAGEIVFRS